MTGLNPGGVTVADLNRDGLPDVIASIYGQPTDFDSSVGGGVDIFLGQKASGLRGAPAYGADTYPWAVTLADLDANGEIDMAAANHDSNDITVLLQQYDGTFAAGVSYAAGTEPTGVAAADFDGDGKIDLAASDASGGVDVLMNTGGGEFASPVSYTTAAAGGIAAGDINGDGKPDLVVAAGGVTVLTNDGHGQFTASTSAGGGCANWRGITLVDMNHDGALDALVVCSGDSSGAGGWTGVLLNVGGALSWGSSLGAGGTSPCSAAAGDFNGDGVSDVVVANEGSDDVSVYLGDGKGGYGSPTEVPVGVNPYAVVATDLNGDGRADIVSANYTSGSVTVLLSTGSGFVSTGFVAGDQPIGLAAGDINGDGKPDIAAASWWDVSPLLNLSQ